jgi:uncharacterized protein
MAAAAHLATSLKTLSTVALGAAGGFAAWGAGLPLPWMMGPMLTVGVAGIARIEYSGHGVHVPYWLRTGFVPVIGVMLGSGFTPAVVAGMREWWITLSALVVFILLSAGIVYQFYRRVFGFDPTTAYFASIPGGLIDMAIIGEGQGGDGRTISLIHFCRILVSVVCLPFLMRHIYTPTGPSAFATGASVAMEIQDVALLAACAVVGFFGGRLLRLPGAQISGPLLLSAIAHATQMTVASPPFWVIVSAQIVVGSGLGARFAGVSMRAAGKSMVAAVGATLLMFAVTLATAFAMWQFVDQPFAALILAYAPGGVTEMSLIALSLNIGVAFITTHHIARIALSIGMMPALWRGVVSKRVPAE